ncbi:hypothetical protein H5410_004953 [Solanum commersonii]|uniref:Uncharacterized protein n=1 Tax=Solanum commersonii TaxID=4109 RepID=A0A9J6A6R5_SOLCO|nr:hypothetical protein H5410_004953 [Solanum commersonii]
MNASSQRVRRTITLMEFSTETFIDLACKFKCATDEQRRRVKQGRVLADFKDVFVKIRKVHVVHFAMKKATRDLEAPTPSYEVSTTTA